MLPRTKHVAQKAVQETARKLAPSSTQRMMHSLHPITTPTTNTPPVREFKRSFHDGDNENNRDDSWNPFNPTNRIDPTSPFCPLNPLYKTFKPLDPLRKTDPFNVLDEDYDSKKHSCAIL